MTSDSIHTPDRFDPGDAPRLAIECIENGRSGLLLLPEATPPEFYDLSTRVLGELVHKLSVYGLRMAVVVEGLEGRSQNFRDFVREANARNALLFFTENRAEAERWLDDEAAEQKGWKSGVPAG